MTLEDKDIEEFLHMLVKKSSGYEPSTVRERMLCAVAPAVIRNWNKRQVINENNELENFIADDVIKITDAILIEAGYTTLKGKEW